MIKQLNTKGSNAALLSGSRHAELRDLLIKAYNAAERPNELSLVRLLGQAYFGRDMLYDGLPRIRGG